MPEPSLLPILNAVGVSLALVGITLSIAVTVVGVVLFLVTLVTLDPRRQRTRSPSSRRSTAPPLTHPRCRRTDSSTSSGAPTRIGCRAVGVEQPDVSSPEVGGLAERYAAAFAAHLDQGGESGLGAAYALGREAVAGQYSVLDFADAHHRALTAALTAAPVGRQGEIVQAAAEFIRESLSAFEIAARGYHEVQEIARIEHEHVEQLRSLADASVAINSSLTAEEILQLTADAARAVLGARRASIAILAAEPRRPPIGATSPEHAGGLRPQPVAPERQPARAGRATSARSRSSTSPEREFSAARRRDPDAARRARVGGDRQRPPVPARAHDRAHARSARCGRARCPTCPGLAAAVRFNAAGEGVELGGDFYDLFRARDGGWAALIGDIQGKGPEAAAVTALARHTLRAAAAYEHRPSGVLTLLHRALREQVVRRALLHRRLRLHAGRPGARAARAGLRRPPAAADRPQRRHASRRSAGSARCWVPTPTRCSPTSWSSSSGRRRARPLHRRRHRGPPPAPRGLRHRAARRAAPGLRRPAPRRRGRARRARGHARVDGQACATTWPCWCSGPTPTRREPDCHACRPADGRRGG